MIEILSGYGACAGEFVRTLKGWHRFGFSFAAGGISALGFPPFDFFPALLLGFAALLLVIDSASTGSSRIRDAAKLGWAFGFGQYLIGLHWIAFSFLIFPGAHEWQLPFLLFFFALLALFQAVACAVAASLWRPGPARILLFALCYGVAEWLRGHVFTGFPWNIPAYGWGASLAVLQSAAVFGAYSLSLLTVLFGAALAELFRPKPNWKPAATMAALFVLMWIGGTVRLWVTPTRDVSGVRLRLVQPNVPQNEKYLHRFRVRNWSRLIELSRAPGDPTIVVWPEAAPPFFIDEQPLAIEAIADLITGRQGLITGGVRREYQSVDNVRYFNSLFVFGPGGRLVATYDKSHLVPFGEYLPYEKTLSALGLEKLTGIDGSFVAGDGPHTYRLDSAGTFVPLVCYEIIFPGEVVVSTRPDWLVNITDDSWFGPWAGPRQHLLVARVRAIEEGLPVARAANTGISAIIDPMGRITESLALNKTGIVDGALPAPIAATAYSRWHDRVFTFIIILNGALTWILSRRKNSVLH